MSRPVAPIINVSMLNMKGQAIYCSKFDLRSQQTLCLPSGTATRSACRGSGGPPDPAASPASRTAPCRCRAAAAAHTTSAAGCCREGQQPQAAQRGAAQDAPLPAAAQHHSPAHRGREVGGHPTGARRGGASCTVQADHSSVRMNAGCPAHCMQLQQRRGLDAGHPL